MATNIKIVLSNVTRRLGFLLDKEYLLRPIAIETIANMKDRIHQKGQASDGGQIGTYSSPYLRYRADHGRGKDTKVIVSMTRKLEADWQVIANLKGYGIGFNDPLNFKKARWVEENQDKKIFNLTTSEKEYVQDRLTELVDNALNS